MNLIKKINIFIIVIFFFFQINPNLHSKEKFKKYKIAVIKFSSKKQDSNLARKTRKETENNLTNESMFTVINRTNIDLVAKVNMVENYSSKNNAIKLGQLTGADFIVMGSIESKSKVHITIINIKEKRAISSFNEKLIQGVSYRVTSKKIAQKITQKINNFIEGKKPISLNIDFYRAYPVGKLSKTLNAGQGVSISAKVENLIFNYFVMGVNFKYIYFEGKSRKTDHIIYLPATYFVGYNYLYNSINIMPEIGAGINYSIDYAYENYEYSKDKKEHSFQPLINLRLNFRYDIWEYFSVNVGSEYAISYQDSSVAQYYSFYAGTCVIF